MVQHGGRAAATAESEASESGGLEPGDAPALDPAAVEHAYRIHRARRRARVERRKASKRAGVRFWLVLLLLVAGSVALVVFVAQEIERLFGI